MIQEQIRSATIYQFPVGGRAGQQLLRDTQRTAIEALPRGGSVAVGESWYHAEAIRDAGKVTT